MKLVLILIFVSGLMHSVSGQNNVNYDIQKEYNGYYKGKPESYYRDLAKKASNLKSKGILLTTLGFVGMTTGYIVSSTSDGIDSDSQNRTGALIFLSGSILMDIGIPLWIYGGIKRSNNIRAANLSIKNHTSGIYFRPVNTGIGLVYLF
jgi:hypothetical protein